MSSQITTIIKTISKKNQKIIKYTLRLDLWKLHFESEIDCDEDKNDAHESTEHKN